MIRIFLNLKRYFQKILYKDINIIIHFKNTNEHEKNNKIIDRKKIYKIFNQHLKWLENNTSKYADLQNIILMILIYLILIYTILFYVNHI